MAFILLNGAVCADLHTADWHVPERAMYHVTTKMATSWFIISHFLWSVGHWDWSAFAKNIVNSYDDGSITNMVPSSANTTYIFK